jgi:putative flavoprotein involved in K+ transport
MTGELGSGPGDAGRDAGPVRVRVRMASLPGMRFPAPPMSYPTKDDMADFLETYASRFQLPVRTGLRVRRLAHADGKYLVTTAGPSFQCDNVVVASGTFGRTPHVPEFAAALDPGILQLHSSAYKDPSQLQPGGVLVVGASHSGGDIAFEAGTAGHPTVLSGPIHGEVPFDIEGRPAHVIFPVLYFLASHLLTIRTPLGRKIRPEVRAHGGPLIRVKRADLARAGVEPAAARTVGVRDGLPVTGDGGWPLETRGPAGTRSTSSGTCARARRRAGACRRDRPRASPSWLARITGVGTPALERA